MLRQLAISRGKIRNIHCKYLLASSAHIVRPVIRCFSETPAAVGSKGAAQPSTPTRKRASSPRAGRFPSRHSRKRFPPLCKDLVELNDLTQSVLEATPGTLFAYQDGKDSMEQAWDAADVSVQKVEYLLRGYAFHIPGTQWNRWTPSDPQGKPDNALETMQSLVGRMLDEGHAYMTVRANRMEETHGIREDVEGASPRISLGESASNFGNLFEAGKSNDSESITEISGNNTPVNSANALAPKSEENENRKSYLDDFAFPGPTVVMYNALLDSMACLAKDGSVNPIQAKLCMENVLWRHTIDGGDAGNRNPSTRPSVLPFNAAIRVAAELRYDATRKDPENLLLRDEALLLAFGTFDAVTHSRVAESNSATYKYLLGAVAKYLPPSLSKGNIAYGMWTHARLQGLIDPTVIAAYATANEPSNGELFDAWARDTLNGKNVTDLPQKWRRNSFTRRFHGREATY
jgi:hypothetical protein